MKRDKFLEESRRKVEGRGSEAREEVAREEVAGGTEDFLGGCRRKVEGNWR